LVLRAVIQRATARYGLRGCSGIENVSDSPDRGAADLARTDAGRAPWCGRVVAQAQVRPI